jgi:LysR family transcriptional regulator, benzoate and cis,cis-muconate-responsive activator of ben and cat genes
MELRHLRYFVAVATARNFTRAADTLGVSQPPLSRQIRDLEDELGVPLFVRDTRPVQLTEAGRTFLPEAEAILAHVEQLARRMKRLSAPRFVVGVVGSILQGAMPEMIRRFRETSPAIDVDLIEMTTIEQIEALKDGRIDAGLGRLRIEDAEIRRTVLHAEPLVLAEPARAEHAQHQAWLEAVSGRTLVLYPSTPRPSYADQVLALLADKGVRPERLIEVREVQTALGLVAAGVGLAIVPESLRTSQRSDIAYTPLADPEAASPIILSQRRADDGALAQRFRAIGLEAFASAS